ncbi:SDR family NAD(P)-dependent oxidoreductase [Paraburkholderia sp.]|uniref:SDR family NAD(P)-dependent oxidoreductase n=1 Tax=Paraburkholderia sp. TaxID=1926495 RepID=UPI0039E26469
METQLTGQIERTVLISGAASGIGAATALRIAHPGTRLLLHTGGRGKAQLADVKARCTAAGAECVTFVGDFGVAGQGQACVELALSSFGSLDQIVHAAGIVRKSPFGELTTAEFNLCMSVMPGAFLEMITAALPSLRTSPIGRVVVVSSFIAHRIDEFSLAPASASAKAAMETLARCLALQLASDGTTVNCVIPGYTQKDPGKLGSLDEAGWRRAAERTPTGRLGASTDVAAAIEFLLSEEARQITGTSLTVDGGITLG